MFSLHIFADVEQSSKVFFFVLFAAIFLQLFICLYFEMDLTFKEPAVLSFTYISNSL